DRAVAAQDLGRAVDAGPERRARHDPAHARPHARTHERELARAQPCVRCADQVSPVDPAQRRVEAGGIVEVAQHDREPGGLELASATITARERDDRVTGLEQARGHELPGIASCSGDEDSSSHRWIAEYCMRSMPGWIAVFFD